MHADGVKKFSAVLCDRKLGTLLWCAVITCRAGNSSLRLGQSLALSSVRLFAL